MSVVQDLIQEFNYLSISASKANKHLVEITNTVNLAKTKKNDDKQRELLKTNIELRDIKFLLHFTPIDNLEKILTYGLLPRDTLEEPANKKIIRAKFPDEKRIDGYSDCFCVSVSWPNYKMLHHKMLSSKSNMKNKEWVIIKINKKHVVEHKCMFFRTNAASFKSRKDKDSNFDDMFYNDQNIRDEINLENHFTTDPQAEIMSSSNIPPSWFENIYFRYQTPHSILLTNKLVKKNLLDRNIIKIDTKFFEARKDYKYWQK